MIMRLSSPSFVPDWIFVYLWEHELAGALRDICSF